jgi:N-methylhydantoinase A
LRDGDLRRLDGAADAPTSALRSAYFPETSWVQTRVLRPGDLEAELWGAGPAIIESPYTTIVINPGARFHVADNGSILVSPQVAEQ